MMTLIISVCAVWVFFGIGILVSIVSPSLLHAIPEVVVPYVACVVVGMVLFVVISCLRHLLASGLSPSLKLTWFFLIFAGHFIGSTAYILLFMRNEVGKARGPSET